MPTRNKGSEICFSMGGSSSTEASSSSEREVESLGALTLLRKAYSSLSDSQSNSTPLLSLQRWFGVDSSKCKAPAMPNCFPCMLGHLGPSIVDLFFVVEKGEISWTEFVKGYNKCCGRISAAESLNNLLRLFGETVKKAGHPSKVHFESDDSDSNLSGSFLPTDIIMLLWMCWIMSCSSKIPNLFQGIENIDLPDLNHLVLSAVVSCAEGDSDLELWNCDISSLDIQLSPGNLCTWALKTVPSLSVCFSQFVHARLQAIGNPEDKLESSSSQLKAHDTHLLTRGRAWAISLTPRITLSEEIMMACFTSDADGIDENLLYRSSLHGKGLNRFWSNVEGYHGPLLMFISGSSEGSCEGDGNVRKWIIGALTQQGFENKDMFYGTSGNIYAISPSFNVFAPSGKEKNFVYSRLHPMGRVYEPHPKPVGIAFGGTMGNERLFIDEDFERVTIRHHAVDKTYQPGSLIPNQGFLQLEALVREVEVWGLGSRTAKEEQILYKKREQLFTEQRRKIDMKKFASNWEESPEKMMMGMMSDPNKDQREDR